MDYKKRDYKKGITKKGNKKGIIKKYYKKGIIKKGVIKKGIIKKGKFHVTILSRSLINIPKIAKNTLCIKKRQFQNETSCYFLTNHLVNKIVPLLIKSLLINTIPLLIDIVTLLINNLIT